MSWARLLKRVFDIDIEHCPNCGGALKIIAAIEDPPVIVRILAHLGLPARAPPRSPSLWMGFQIRVILGVPQKWAYIMQTQMFRFSSWLTLFCLINTIARGDRH